MILKIIMKKFFIIILVLIPVFCFSQTYVGIKTGYSLISSISFVPDIKAKAYIGENIDYGVVIKNYDNKWVGFQGELYMTQRGYDVPILDTNYRRRINSYLELPIFIQGQLNLKWFTVHANAGCFAAYLLSSKEGVDTSGRFVLNNVKFNILRDNRFDYGLIGGVGVSREFKWGVIQIEARILYGFTDLYKYNYKDNPKESKAVEQNITFTYLFNLSKIGHKKNSKNP